MRSSLLGSKEQGWDGPACLKGLRDSAERRPSLREGNPGWEVPRRSGREEKSALTIQSSSPGLSRRDITGSVMNADSGLGILGSCGVDRILPPSPEFLIYYYLLYRRLIRDTTYIRKQQLYRNQEKLFKHFCIKSILMGLSHLLITLNFLLNAHFISSCFIE